MSSLGKKGLTSNQYLVDILCLQHYELKFQTRKHAQKKMIFQLYEMLTRHTINFVQFSKPSLFQTDIVVQ